MPASPIYTIYAAPRVSDDRYRLCKEKPLFMQEFSTLMAIQQCWEQTIVPATSTKFGTAYELSMVEANAVMWDFIGDPRYAHTSIITRRIREGGNIHDYQDDRQGLPGALNFENDGVCIN